MNKQIIPQYNQISHTPSIYHLKIITLASYQTIKHYKKEDRQKRKLCLASEKMQQNLVTKLTKGESLGQLYTN